MSEAAAQPLRRVMKGHQPVFILPNGIDPDDWEVERRAKTPGTFLVTSVMRLAPRKRPIQLLRILAKARKLTPSGTDLRAEIIGDGPERSAMERFIRRHAMSGWVRLAGRVDREEIRSVYERADLFIAPATYESFGIAALEARASRVPVLARSGTGVSEFVVDGQDGFLVESDDAMAEAIAGLAREPGVGGRFRDSSVPYPTASPGMPTLRQCELLYVEANRRAGVSWIGEIGIAADPETVSSGPSGG